MHNNPSNNQSAHGNNIVQVSGDHSTAVLSIYEYVTSRPVDEVILTEARKKLATLPLDTVPNPNYLPSGSLIPYSFNPYFVGREDDLKKIAATLKEGGVTAVVATTGIGGVGKTQLAVEFAHRYGQYFSGGVFWLSFADPENIRSEIATCGGPGALALHPNFSNLSLDDQVRMVLAAWSSPLPYLIIFDNCEQPNLLTQWHPRTGGSRILLTSRRAIWEGIMRVRTISLEVLSEVEGVALLRKYLPELSEENPDLAAIVKELGGLPLALHLAGSFLSNYRYSDLGRSDIYLAALQNPTLLEHPSLEGWGTNFSPTDHDLHVARTFIVSFTQLEQNDHIDNRALILLSCAAYFAPGELIPRTLLLSTLEQFEQKLVDNESKGKNIIFLAEDALRRLINLGLLEQGERGALKLHRLLSVFVQNVSPNNEAKTVVEDVLLDEMVQANKTNLPSPALEPHWRFITGAAQARRDERAERLFNELGAYLQVIGDYTAAQPYYEHALSLSEERLGEGHLNTVTELNNLGLLLIHLGKYTEAQPYLERALHKRKQNLPENHPALANSLNSLGELYKAQGEYDKAMPYLVEALAINEKAFGQNHEKTANSLNNFGMLLVEIRDFDGSQPYLQRALSIREKLFGENHPSTAMSLHNLGTLFLEQENFEEARHYLKRALNVTRDIYGDEHPDTAGSLANLGQAFTMQGSFGKARSYLFRALAIREKLWGENHPSTINSLNSITTFLLHQRNYQGALVYARRALTPAEKVFGVMHLKTGIACHNLGMALRYSDNEEEAQVYLRRALDICEQKLGPSHPHTMQLYYNLVGHPA